VTRLEAAQMRFLRSVQGYTRLDTIRSEVIKKLEISGIQDVKSKYKQNWIIHLEIMDNTRLLKHALNYRPRGRRDRGNASMPEQLKRPNPWRKMMMMMMMMIMMMTMYKVTTPLH
jgi:hypothetical protein